ncbi:MAG: C40 family peptidase, partial [Mycolicibacterium aromaticivorans]|nr:C40 family peptidase [Mycolicibacterium aromaticivorans]
GGRTDEFTAVLTAGSPQQLIDQLALQWTMSTEMSDQMRAFQKANDRAVLSAQTSATSAAAARTAAEQAATVRAELQSKQSDLRRQVVAVQTQYDALTPDQRIALADPGLPPPLPAGPPPRDPTILAMPDQQVPIQIAPPGEAVAAAAPRTQAATVVQAALTRIGSPYSWGASGPNAFDCSGLIMWAFQQTGKSLPHSSQAMAEGGQPVALSDMEPGDIVTFYDDASHAGIYIGDGLMVHSSTYGTPVRVSPVSTTPIHNVRRW